MIWVILIIICAIPLYGYGTAVSQFSLIWQMSLALVGVVTVCNVIVHLVTKGINKKIESLYFDEKRRLNNEVSEVQKKIELYEKDLSKLSAYLTEDELQSVFRVRSNLTYYTDKEIEDLFIWLAYYKPSEEEYKNCWLYDHYRFMVDAFDEIESDVLTEGFLNTSIAQKAANYIKLGLARANEIMQSDESYKNTVIRTIVYMGILYYVIAIGKEMKMEKSDIAPIENLINTTKPLFSITEGEGGAFISLVKKGVRAVNLFPDYASLFR